MRHYVMMILLLAAFVAMAQAATPIRWEEVAHWRFAGTRNLETFRVDAREWRVRWAIQGDMPISVWIYDAATDRRIDSAGSGKGGADGYTVLRGAGEYYLEVIDWGTDRIDIWIEVRR
jgi:hypothetical protein